MKFIKEFGSFLNEDLFTPQSTDPEELISKMNHLNQLDKWIKEFPTQKGRISNIFSTYKDENEKFSNLKPFLTDASNPKKLQFKNELLGLWAEVCSFNRQISDTENALKDKKTEMSDEQKSVNALDPTSKELGKENIDVIKKSIDNTDIMRKSLEEQLMSKNKEAEAKLKKYKQELERGKNEINIYNQQKLRKI